MKVLNVLKPWTEIGFSQFVLNTTTVFIRASMQWTNCWSNVAFRTALPNSR